LERLILDTTVLIAAERSTAALEDVIHDQDDVAMAAITAAELLVGVHLADRHRTSARRTFVDELLSSVPVEAYDLDTARVHAELLVHARKQGRTRGAHDLLIAATARARARAVVTADAAGFEDLPGVELRILRTR
jgi:tRNA(fMet)-specific endonuclease VapC